VRQIDRRRPQVQIEAVLVELSADDNLNLGIELESWQPGTHGETTTLFFTSFGLSTIDPNTGQRTLIAQPGVGAAILRPDEVPFVLSALQATGKASIMSYPKVLVNDNVAGTISSIREEPYTQVNASNTVATTSFGGYIQAGIQFGVVPHISENNYLRLEYQVQLNSFVGSPTTTVSGTLPPARDTNTVQSEVTVPDNHTIIIGGLQRQLQGQSVRKVPLLGDIPGVGLLFQTLNKTSRTVTLYFFLRPQILRDDRFLDLKLISQQAADRAEIGGQWPRNPAIAISNTETYQSWQIEADSAASQPAE
jgi:general secretion pathway protein D